jgi:GalNAc-alpha-(1->4)-GalNAc-alpha-(1->3)-diNAcBac-PP-undecaprenol alpha-1,4-N-acetyl-D-galactosaminyltransferase
MSELANVCSIRGWSVRLVTIDGTSSDFYRLVPEIDRVPMDSLGKSGNIFEAFARNWQRISRLRKSVTSFKPDVVLVFGARTNVLAVLAMKGTGIPVVVSERTDPFELNIGFPWNYFQSWAYRDCAKVIAQTQKVAKKMELNWKLHNLCIIPNPLAREVSGALKVDHERNKIVLSVGRLSHVKGHDILLDAWASVRNEFPEWRLRLVGDGPERNSLQAQSKRLGLDDCLDFAGSTCPVWPEYFSAQVFVLPSRREGFPNVLLEAMACGCTCVASNCNSGPAELLKGGELGYLFEPNSPEKLAAALRIVLRQSSGKPNLKKAQEVRSQYEIDKIADQWMKMLIGLAK